MKVVFDTNALLDAILRRGDYTPAQKLIYLTACGRIVGVMTANSITDIYYIARKAIGDDGSRTAISDLLTLLDVAPVDGETCAAALALPMKDYEDAVLAACAQREHADYIITRDEEFLQADGCPVSVVRPTELLKLLDRSEA
jgi:predicted nucleic acid-binding protein